MEFDTTKYVVSTTRECIKYIEANGVTLEDDNSQYSINSKSGLVYMLPNNEVVLIPTNLDPEYPGIIFKEKSYFLNCVHKDFFPIDEDKMTWLEKNNSRVIHFQEFPSFYSNVVEQQLNIKYPLTKLVEMEKGFEKLKLVLKTGSKKAWDPSFQEVVYCFGFSIIDYLMSTHDYQLRFEKSYENYNPYSYPFLFKNGIKINILSKLFRYIESDNKNSFTIFLRNVELNSTETGS
ncbi:MAG: hypothetical protein QM768_07415 [Agriterribacter sp.]